MRDEPASRKRALIVDDSKSARVVLGRMLERYDIEVDVAESAEQAIEYLKHGRPDAIFMDHLMPGMDGLQAVQTIKSDVRTAKIPIMMYTSQAGELYVGQARALGASGVLPKQVKPVDVSKVLHELHMLPGRREQRELLPAQMELDASAPANSPPTLMPAPAPTYVRASISAPSPTAAPPPTFASSSAAAQHVSAPDWGRQIEATVKQQSMDLRRFIVASLDGITVRVASELRAGSVAPQAAVEPAHPFAPKRRPIWPVAAGLTAACAAALVCAVLLIFAREDLKGARGEVATLRSANGDLNRARDQLAATVKDLTAALAAAAQPANEPVPEAVAAAGLPTSEPVPYGELPLEGNRLDRVREALGKLWAQGFRGTVKLRSSAGSFCLRGSTADGFVPASASLPASQCDLIGNPLEDSAAAQQRESAALANLNAGVRQRTRGAITVAFERGGSARAAVPYPARSESPTAGEWNRAAAANNRLEIGAQPASSP